MGDFADMTEHFADGVDHAREQGLLNDEGPLMHIQTLSAVFEPGDRPYTFMVPDTLAAKVAPGDLMLVDTTAGLRIVTIEDVHGCDKRDPKLVAQGIKFKWAFAKLPDGWREYLEELKAFESLLD